MLLIASTLCCLRPEVASAGGADCMPTYYRAKSPACIDAIFAAIQQAPPRTVPNNLVGFLAELFRSSSKERERILTATSSDYLKSVTLTSLWLAGLTEEARRFAATNNLSAPLEQLAKSSLVALDAIKPSSLPGDNDLLIGAYMASGNTDFIQRILGNYSSADDEMVRDGLRMGFMMSKFGPNLAPKGRAPVMTRVACEKYQCKSDARRLLRVMTLASALWALQSLSQQDERIKKTLNSFFTGDPRLKTSFLIEQNAFANYLTTVVGLTALNNPAGGEPSPGYAAMSKSADIYEKLGPANEAFAPLQDIKK